MKAEHSVAINLPPGEIFAYLSDLEKMTDWSGAVIAARKISPGAMHTGATVRCTIRFLGRWSETYFEIVEFKPNRYLTIKSVSGVAPSLIYYRFQPIEDGGTIVSMEAIFHLMEGFLGLAEPVLTSMIHRQLEYDLLTLKDLLEAGTSIYSSAG